ncbi:MAG TPA: hypothetical protein VL574_00375 [Stellaceae bacterium]|jgi:hypothetical protein|nr:hypothetical protein [Stellaceae bacterium]
MTVTPLSANSIPYSIDPSPKQATETNQAVLQNSIGEYVVKDQIDLSKKAVDLLIGAQPAAK